MSRGTALITGASSGIGEALALKFSQEGFDLVLTARRQDRLQALKDKLEGGRVTIFTADLTTDEGLIGLCRFVEEQRIDVDILINNAGMLVHDSFEDASEDQLRQSIALNITALTRLIYHFLPKMKERRAGRILNVASVAAFNPIPGMDLYAATKAYVLSLTESLSESLRDSGVSLTALCPGLTETEGMDQRLAANLPPFLIGTPEEVALEGYDALMQQEVIRIPGNANKLAVALAQHQPRWLVRGLGGLASRFTR
ncbi:MAG: SDR family oxidoreductase [Gammaproteobacteria bacterium]|jgi:uncharacterized protein|nr:SDR family oxidoreductase [Gammaproteobacteria bacterium]MBT4492016.1 SDR family oxidoreductase [Gammaproteobacteria bacterium]MBT7370975.1 SDR family oxidoreductase [Gammaproteobacteria bacterium]